MAKLPDINYVRAVPTLKSARAAALPGKLQSINAIAGGISKGASAIGDVVETKLEQGAKLDATRRYHSAVRDHAQDRKDLVQDYHINGKTMEEFTQDYEALRVKSMDTARKDIGSRGARYLEPQMEAFHTAAALNGIKDFEALSESRAKMNIELSSRDILAGVDSSEESVDLAVAAIGQKFREHNVAAG